MRLLRPAAGRCALALILLALNTTTSAAPVDAPELASPGAYAVGLRRVSVDVGAVPDVDALAGGNAAAPARPRRLEALLWYPAAPASAAAAGGGGAGGGATQRLERELKNHAWRGWSSPVHRMSVPSVALADALVAAGNPGSAGSPSGQTAPGGSRASRWPVVVMSHGLLMWAELMSDLAEHLASRGYVVLSVQHDDERHADPLRAALALRSLDQGAAMRVLEQLDATVGDPLHQRLAATRVALIGYSMGGYGALVTAGARVADDGMAYRYAPAAAMARHALPLQGTDAAMRDRVAAVVAFAPWGGQAAFGALRPAGMRTLRQPTLLVAGDQDDISGYVDGTRGIWDAMAAAPRWLLTYENARHNIVQNAVPAGLPAGFRSWETLEEPVWRRDRLLDINRHFVTAFLDARLRGDSGSEQWLNLATVRANDGVWAVPFGTPANGQLAGPANGAITHWAGFQRRWALGLRLERKDPSTN